MKLNLEMKIVLTEEQKDEVYLAAEKKPSPEFEDYVEGLLQEAFDDGRAIGRAECPSD